MARTVLVVDDIEINRRILKKILSDEYEILEAENGKEAMTLLRQESHKISAVLLDLMMPVMDGFAVLERMQKNPILSQIPVIVTTGNTELETEDRALMLGAMDFVHKPFDARIIRRRLMNLIRLRETSSIINSYQRDKLTGLYNRNTFFDKAAGEIRRKPDGYYYLSCIDIDNFKLINDQFGSERGDEVLKGLSDLISKYCDDNGGLCGRINADNFVVLLPTRIMARAREDRKKMCEEFGKNNNLSLSFSTGYYIVDEKKLSVSAMYDRAAIARNTVKGRYDVNETIYDENMRSSMVRAQEIINEMNQALKTGQFEPWFQPQYNHASGALIGAEALARWRHPQRGMISPGEFIPVFERNGFIYELDKTIWEQVCQHLRRWIDEGRNPLPISVNISRYDLFRPDLVDTILGLVKKYQLSEDMLRLEITESAFAQSLEKVVEVVTKFIGHGFTIEIDDFGSGYSSLNTLKDVPAQILKLDMRFLVGNDNLSRGGSIIESIVRMAKWLGMAVIAEGVEENTQADYLKSIGCNYIQGYLYSKPLPLEEYESLALKVVKEEHLITMEIVDNVDNHTLWNPESIDTLVFNNYVGAACIFELCNGKLELIRSTDQFIQIFSSDQISMEDMLQLHWEKYLDAENFRKLTAAIEQSLTQRGSVTEEIVLSDLPGCPKRIYLRQMLRVIANTGSRYLVFSTTENITTQRESERKIQQADDRLRAIMSNMNDGISVITKNSDGTFRFLFTNDQYYRIFGYTRQQYEREISSIYDWVYPEDQTGVRNQVETLMRTKVSSAYRFRCIRRNGEIITVSVSSSVIRMDDVSGDVLLSIVTDITETMRANEKIKDGNSQIISLNETMRTLFNSTPCGFARMRVNSDGTLSTVFVNEALCRIRDMSAEEIYQSGGENSLVAIHPDDLSRVKSAIQLIISSGEKQDIPYRLLRSDGSYVLLNAHGQITHNEMGVPFVNLYYTELSEKDALEINVRETLPFVLSAIMEASSDICFAKDRKFRYICCSTRFAQYLGLKSPIEIVGKTDYEIHGAEHAEKFRKRDMEVFDSGLPLVDYVEPIPSSDGVEHYSKKSKYPLRDTTGEIIGLYCVIKDITDENLAVEQIKLLTDNLPIGIVKYEVRPDHIRMLYANDGVFPLSGYTKSEYMAMFAADPFALVYQEDLPDLHELVRLINGGAERVSCTFRIHTKGGSFHWIDFKGKIADRRSDFIFLDVVMTDVTAIRLTQMELFNTNEQLQAIMENMNGGVAAMTIIGGKLDYLFYNDQYCNMFGYTREQFDSEIPNGLVSLVLEEYKAELDALTEKNEKESGIATTSFCVRCRDDSVKWVHASDAICYMKGHEAPVHVAVFYDITEDKLRAQQLQKILEELREGEERFRLASQMSGLIIGRYDVRKRQYIHNDLTLRMLGMPDVIENVPIAFVDAGIVAPEGVNALKNFYARLDNGETPCQVETPLKMANGEFCWCQVDGNVIFDDAGQAVQAIIVTTDISEEREKTSAFRRWQQSIDERNPDDYTLFRWNLSADKADKQFSGRLLGGDFSCMLKGTFAENTINYAREHVHPDDREEYISVLNIDKMLASYLRGNRSRTLEYREVMDDNSVRWLQLTIELVEYLNSKEVEALLLYENIDEKKKEELLVRKRAELDPLTSVLNRQTFASRTNDLIKNMVISSQFALIMLDVDGFKLLNDSFGHAAGDQALIEMANAIRAILRSDDLLGRLGGDEFLVGLRDVPNDEVIEDKARQICSRLRKTYSLEVYTSVSLGIAVYPRDGEDFDTIYHKADVALYHVKDSGKDNYLFYRPEMGELHRRGESRNLPSIHKPDVDGTAKRRMLVVEDNELDAALCGEIFKNLFEVEHVRDGSEALQRLRHYGNAVSVVLLDLGLPGMSGREVLNVINSSIDLQTIPVIVVTADERRETNLEMIRAGAADYVEKPVDGDLLRIRVQSAVSKAENERLRAQNSFLSLQSDEVNKYRLVLESNRTTVVEFDPRLDVFDYEGTISQYIAGTFDNRPLWLILLTDAGATNSDITALQDLVHALMDDPKVADSHMELQLMTPAGTMHRFGVHLSRLFCEHQLADKIILAFTDMGA